MTDEQMVQHLAARIASACELLDRGLEVAGDLIDDDLARAQALDQTAKNTRAILAGALVDLLGLADTSDDERAG